MKSLEPISYDELAKGMQLLCFDAPGGVRVGRIHSEITIHSGLKLLLTGIVAEFDLLYADRHLEAEDLAWQQYFTFRRGRPESQVYKWPTHLMKLTFKKTERGLSTFRGYLTHIQIHNPNIEPPIIV